MNKLSILMLVFLTGCAPKLAALKLADSLPELREHYAPPGEVEFSYGVRWDLQDVPGGVAVADYAALELFAAGRGIHVETGGVVPRSGPIAGRSLAAAYRAAFPAHHLVGRGKDWRLQREAPDTVTAVLAVAVGGQFTSPVALLASAFPSVEFSQVGPDRIVARGPALDVEAARGLVDVLSAVRKQYRVTVTVVDVSARAAASAGVETLVEASGQAGGLLSTEAVASPSASVGINAAAVWRAAASDSSSRIVESAQLVVIDGETAQIQVGQTTPRVNRAISPEGTVTVLNTSDVDTGLTMQVLVRAAVGGAVRVEAQPELSSVTGFVDGAPIRARRRVSVSAVVLPGSIIVAGGFALESGSGDTSGALPGFSATGMKSRSTEARRVFVLLAVDVLGSESAPAPGSPHSDPHGATS